VLRRDAHARRRAATRARVAAAGRNAGSQVGGAGPRGRCIRVQRAGRALSERATFFSTRQYVAENKAEADGDRNTCLRARFWWALTLCLLSHTRQWRAARLRCVATTRPRNLPRARSNPQPLLPTASPTQMYDSDLLTLGRAYSALRAPRHLHAPRHVGGVGGLPAVSPSFRRFQNSRWRRWRQRRQPTPRAPTPRQPVAAGFDAVSAFYHIRRH